jgi:hypothetical protein
MRYDDNEACASRQAVAGPARYLRLDSWVLDNRADAHRLTACLYEMVQDRRRGPWGRPGATAGHCTE